MVRGTPADLWHQDWRYNTVAARHLVSLTQQKATRPSISQTPNVTTEGRSCLSKQKYLWKHQGSLTLKKGLIVSPARNKQPAEALETPLIHQEIPKWIGRAGRRDKIQKVIWTRKPLGLYVTKSLLRCSESPGWVGRIHIRDKMTANGPGLISLFVPAVPRLISPAQQRKMSRRNWENRCSHSKQDGIGKLFVSVRPRFSLPDKWQWIGQGVKDLGITRG